jgi:hypothetical protein
MRGGLSLASSIVTGTSMAFLADGFEVVVACGRGRAETRTRLWTRDDSGCPRNLPGVGSAAHQAIVPIDIGVSSDDLPAGAGVPTS